jgi:hypothetical protein
MKAHGKGDPVSETSARQEGRSRPEPPKPRISHCNDIYGPVGTGRLFVVEGGDHSFKVLKRAGVPQARVDETVQDEIARWLRERLRGGAGGC